MERKTITVIQNETAMCNENDMLFKIGEEVVYAVTSGKKE